MRKNVFEEKMHLASDPKAIAARAIDRNDSFDA
jgi:hypothetical protein